MLADIKCESMFFGMIPVCAWGLCTVVRHVIHIAATKPDFLKTKILVNGVKGCTLIEMAEVLHSS